MAPSELDKKIREYLKQGKAVIIQTKGGVEFRPKTNPGKWVIIYRGEK